MGAWSAKQFDNDDAADFVLGANECSDVEQLAQKFRKAFDQYQTFDQKRDRGENKEIRTAEYVEWALKQFSPPLTEKSYAGRIMLATVGQEVVDTGAGLGFEAIAAGHLVRIAATESYGELPPEMSSTWFRSYRPNLRMLESALSALKLLPKNKELSRNCGAAWKKNVWKLLDDLEEVADRLRQGVR